MRSMSVVEPRSRQDIEQFLNPGTYHYALNQKYSLQYIETTWIRISLSESYNKFLCHILCFLGQDNKNLTGDFAKVSVAMLN